ncbi:hypothetical protein GCM10009760_15290 [Kitasatospora kazusensis]|uniref:Uncharacterized protein n=1 Tax=Kitasatospora kazusensis TaxID=407974 RepID=A0ABP5KU89_9ACTN
MTVPQNPLTVVKLLWCGQGQLGLVEIYNDGIEKKDADFLALINCGGETKYAQESLDYITAKVEARHRKLLNLVVFTAMDEGSTNLLDELAGRLTPLDARMTACFVTGSDWEGKGPEAVKGFVGSLNFSLDSVEFAGARQSDYLGTGTAPTWIAEHNGTYVRILATDDGPTVMTTVLVVENGIFCVVLPGRLSLSMMRAISAIPELKTRLPGNRALLLPNRSALESLVTDYRMDPTGGNADRMKVVEDFAAAVSPTGICVSAGVSSGSPVAQVLEKFTADLAEGVEHTYVCYDLPDAANIFGEWQTRTTTKAIRTTLRTYGAQQQTTFGQIRISSRLRSVLTDSEQ